MIEKLKWKRIPGSLVIASAFILAGTFGTASTAAAQNFDDLQTPETPLVLEAQGSFYVGGTLKDGDDCPPAGGTLCPIMADQAYVRFMRPENGDGTPVVLIAGAGLGGKTFETTPDGRMGWLEYFVRNGHDSYAVDPVWVGRSGFNYSPFQRDMAPNMISISTPSPERAWVSFRVGKRFGHTYAQTKFPTDHINELAKQGFPFFFQGSPFGPCAFVAPCSTVKELVTKLEAAVVFGHSFRGSLPVAVARALQTPEGNPVKAAVNIDGCPGAGAPPDTPAGNAELATLKDVAMLGVLGDNRGTRPGPAECQEFIDRFALVGGFAQTIALPEDEGIKGNTHMMMLDTNNLEVADIILEWIAEHVDKTNVASN